MEKRNGAKHRAKWGLFKNELNNSAYVYVVFVLGIMKQNAKLESKI